MARLLGPLLFICGTGRGSYPTDDECEGRGWEWDGGEVPVGGEAIRDKDTERGRAAMLKFYVDVHRTKKN
jgi:hypothetical protein